ncbi:MAG: hypothetical protein ACI8ZB_005525 [Desulforhopalus sp.]|jgi:hypothetical protein
MEGSYLLNLDGTGYFSSKNLHSDACLKKCNKKTGVITYHLQMVGAAMVHPDMKEVIALAPETIRRQDGETKMDCERNAVRCLLGKLRQEHPHLKFIINEDGLSSNGPHIKDMEKYNFKYILGAKQGDHKFLFQYVDSAAAVEDTTEFTITDKGDDHLTHCFRIVYNTPLNKTNQDKLVTFIEYWEKTARRAGLNISVG